MAHEGSLISTTMTPSGVNCARLELDIDKCILISVEQRNPHLRVVWDPWKGENNTVTMYVTEELVVRCADKGICYRVCVATDGTWHYAKGSVCLAGMTPAQARRARRTPMVCALSERTPTYLNHPEFDLRDASAMDASVIPLRRGARVRRASARYSPMARKSA